MKNVMKGVMVLMALLACKATYAQNAKVVIFRDAPLYGAMQEYEVQIDGVPQVKLKQNEMVSSYLKPGKHTISTQDGEILTFNATNAEFYVVKVGSGFAVDGAKPKLKLMNFEEAREDSKFFRDNYRDVLAKN